MIDCFIADLHLQDSRPALTKEFLELVSRLHGHTARLFILGDLFEYWIGDDVSSQLADQVADALRGLSATGCSIYFMAGNRDFLIGDDYCRRCAMRRLIDPATILVSGQPVLLSHGDFLCVDDIEYQQARQMLRDPRWQEEFLAQSVEQRLAFAEDARRKSEAHTRDAEEEIMDVSAAAVSELLKTHDKRVLVHGHTHRPAYHHIADPQAERWVLPDWRDAACGIVAKGGSLAYFASADELVSTAG